MALPPIEPHLPYLAGYDGLGIEKVMQRWPGTSRGFVYWDGVNFVFASGTTERPIVLTSLVAVTGTSFPSLMGMTASGQVVQIKPPVSQGKWRLQMEGGVFNWVVDTQVTLPSGSGLFGRDKNNNNYALGGVDEKGLYFAKGDGDVELIPVGNTGASLVVDANGKPTFSGSISGGTAPGGGASTGLSGVNSSNTSGTSITIVCPRITLDDGAGDTIVATDVNVTVNTTAAPGAGGIDTGAITSQWYHLYIIGNDSGVAGIFSLDQSTPDLSNATEYTHYAYAGVFRYDSGAGAIIDYVQRGRKFYTKERVGVTSSGLTFNTWVSLSFSTPLNTLIPPNCQSCSGHYGGTSGNAVSIVVDLAASNSGMDIRHLGGLKPLSTVITSEPNDIFGVWVDRFDDLLIIDPSAPQIYARSHSSTAGNNTAGKTTLTVCGYTI